MKMRQNSNLGISVSAFGLGCMRVPMTKNADGKDTVDEKICTEIIRTAIDGGVNYLDTAYVYSGGLNEKYVGKALRDGYREKVYLATKLPPHKCASKEDMYKLFEEQCANLETDYIDFYLLHSLNAEKWRTLDSLGVKDFLDDLKAKGKIKFASFSFHGSYEEFEEILNSYSWDMCQIQFNYMDINNQAGLKGLKLAGEKGIPVVIMEGLLGGKLANVPEEVKELFENHTQARSAAEWAFRWLCNFPEVLTVLSGTSNVEQTKDNLRIFSSAEVGCMSESELEIIDKARELYRKRIKVDCTGCAYCMPCPMGVDIPGIFSSWNNAYRFGSKNYRYGEFIKNGSSADKCVSCRKCEKHCPQSLSIPELLASAHSEATK